MRQHILLVDVVDGLGRELRGQTICSASVRVDRCLLFPQRQAVSDEFLRTGADTPVIFDLNWLWRRFVIDWQEPGPDPREVLLDLEEPRVGRDRIFAKSLDVALAVLRVSRVEANDVRQSERTAVLALTTALWLPGQSSRR